MPFAWDPWALLGFISVVLVPTPALTLQICTGGTVQTGLNLNNHCTGASRRELRTHNGVRRYPSRGRYCTMNADNVAEGGGADGGLSTFYSREDLDKFCSPWGITLHYSNVLNIYRIEARRSNGEVAGYTSGFHAGDMLHLDTVQAGNYRGLPAQTRFSSWGLCWDVQLQGMGGTVEQSGWNFWPSRI
ncbi:unnamed protein product [Discosporangium mesarthrocarpum]